MTNIFLQEVLRKDKICDKVIFPNSCFRTVGYLVFERKIEKYYFFSPKRLQIQK